MAESETQHADGAPDLGPLIEANLPALRAFVRLNLSPDLRARESCSDLVQSVCRELVAQGGGFEFRGHEALRAWLFRAALHKIRDHAKYHRADKRARRREVPLDDAAEAAALYASLDTPSAHAIGREHAELVERAFDRLEAGDREVITLCRVLGLPRGAAASVLGKSAGAVRMHLNRALARLARELDALGLRF